MVFQHQLHLFWLDSSWMNFFFLLMCYRGTFFTKKKGKNNTFLHSFLLRHSFWMPVDMWLVYKTYTLIRLVFVNFCLGPIFIGLFLIFYYYPPLIRCLVYSPFTHGKNQYNIKKKKMCVGSDFGALHTLKIRKTWEQAVTRKILRKRKKAKKEEKKPK